MAFDLSSLLSREARGGVARPDSRQDASVTAFVEPVRARRSWRYAAGALAAILAGGLLSVALYTQAQHTESVFIVAGTVERGHTFTARDLAVLDVSAGQRVDGFTTAQSGQIIGKVATEKLPTGSLITRAAVAVALPIPSGRAVVGVAVKTSQMPATSIGPGDAVIITPIAGDGGTLTAKDAAAVDIEAVVVDAPTTDQTTGLVVVDVSVPSAEASDLAGRAATGQVAIYLTGGQGR